MSITNLASPDKTSIREFFDAIAPRYDFINSFLSFRLDDLWRKWSRDIVLEPSQKSILDLGIGTGKFLRVFLKNRSWERAAGVDFSESMLSRARQELPCAVELVRADFHDLPFNEESFDLIVSAFTLRSVKDMNRFLCEVHRMLTPRGKAAFLCLTRPTRFFWRLLYYPYVKFYLPCVGSLISGHEKAYRFLAESIEHFQDPQKTLRMMAEVGFASGKLYPFTMGAATLIVGQK